MCSFYLQGKADEPQEDMAERKPPECVLAQCPYEWGCPKDGARLQEKQQWEQNQTHKILSECEELLYCEGHKGTKKGCPEKLWSLLWRYSKPQPS